MDTRYNTTSNGQPNNGRWLPDMNLLNKLFDSNHVVESPEKPNESISNHNCTNRRLPCLNILHILSDSNFVVESPPTCSLLTCSNTETENSCSIGHAGIYLLGRFSTARTNTKSNHEKFIPTLSIKNKYLSNQHCVIVFGKPLGEAGTGWYVIDLNSTNGTYKNKFRLVPYVLVAIKENDFFNMAGSHVRYHISVGDYNNKIAERHQIL